MEPQKRIVQAGEVRIAFSEWPGERGPILCLPSLVGHKGCFDEVASRLSPDFHLIAVDFRGRGESDQPSEGYGFAYHARDILSLAEALVIEDFSIIGHSFGATVGVYLASIRPQRIRSLVMIDGGADPKVEVLEAMRPTLRNFREKYPSLEAYLEAMRAIAYYQPWNQALERYLVEDMLIQPDGTLRSRSSAEAIEQDLDIHFYYSMCVHFPTLQCPSLFVRPRQGLLGDRAHVLDEREAAAFVNSIPSCWRVDIPDVNHFTMLLSENPLVEPPIRAFLTTYAPGPSPKVPG